MNNDGRKRVVIDYVGPQVDCGLFPVKRAVGEAVKVVAHAFADGHDQIQVELLYKKSEHTDWTIRTMAYQINDEWSGSFKVTGLGSYLYTVRGWVDPFATWQSDLRKKREVGQNVDVELKIGAALLRRTAQAAEPGEARKLAEWAMATRLASRQQLCGGNGLERRAGRGHAEVPGQVARHDLP